MTAFECNAILVVALVLVSGLTLRFFQQDAQAFSAETYAEADRQLETAKQALAAVPINPVSEVIVSDTVRVASAVSQNTTPEPKSALGEVARMNLNTASGRQLQLLPRIGPKMAERILAYRAQHGPFRRVEDLVRVRGIGEKTLAKLKPYVFVEEG